MHAWNQGGIIISIYDISFLKFLFCKNTVSLEEWVAAKRASSTNGWLHLDLHINSILLKKGIMTADVCFKKLTVPLKILDHCNWHHDDGTTQIYGCKCSFGNNAP